MTHNPIYITRTDLEKIHALLHEAENSGYRGSLYVQKLKDELARAIIVEPHELLPDVIALNTRAALIDIETGEQMELTLVVPEEADLRQGKISILAPIGAAMLGFRKGDQFEWETPDGKRLLRIEKIIAQP